MTTLILNNLTPQKLVFLKDVKLIRVLEFGVLFVVEALWERSGLGSILRSLSKESGYKIPYERALLAMVANRLCEPESKLGVWDRWLSKVYMPSCRDLKLAHMYEALDLLYEHSEEVEKSVFFQAANLLNLDVDIVFYDTTTVSFSTDYEDEDSGLRKRGKSKDGTWSPQVVVALAVTASKELGVSGQYCGC